MTLSATPAVDRYTADGSQTVFDYNFKILDSSHLQVFFGDVVQGSGFTVSGVNNDTGGTVTFDTAPTSGVIVTLRQEVPLDQPSALPNQGPFPSQTVETQIADRIVMQNKQQQEELDRSVKVAVSSTLTELDLTPAPGQFVAWNQDGDALIGTDATPDTVPVSAFGATLVDDADASAALTTLGHSDYVKNNLIQSASADAHLATLLPAIDTVLETITGLVDVGVFHPAMDEHAEWYDGVTGARSRFMMATAQTAGGNSTVKIWDLTVATPVELHNIPLTNSVVSAISDIKGGVIAIATEDGLFRRGWTKAGFGAIPDGLPDPITSATVPALTNNDLDDVCIGYSDQPAGNPATGGQKPTIGGVYGTGADAAFILKDDGKLFDALGTVGDVGCGIAAGWFYHADAPASHRMVVDRISEIQGDDWGALTFLSNGQDPFGFGVGNDFDITPGQNWAAASADGLTVGWIAGNNREVDERFTALISRTYNTGWIFGDIRGVWLANSKTADRSYLSNALTETGVVTEASVTSGAELNGYSGFSSVGPVYLERASDPDWNAIGTGGVALVGWLKSSGTAATEILFGFGDTLVTRQFNVAILTDGSVLGTDHGATANTNVQSAAGFDDGNWHFVVFLRRSSTDRELWLDGILVASSAADAGSLSGTVPFAIGRRPDGGNYATTSTMSLVRLSVTTPSAAQIRHMYETERRLFEANAKCLLQGAADAVQCVAIDPVTSDLFVGQADSLQRFEGLLMAEERLAAGETWTSDDHKGIRAAGGALLLANAAESYASVPAIDLRSELQNGPASSVGVDLSKAKAWALFVGTGTVAILASHNVKSLTDQGGSGQYLLEWAVPFKTDNYVAVPSAQLAGGGARFGTQLRESLQVVTHNAGGTLTDSALVAVAAYGELENE